MEYLNLAEAKSHLGQYVHRVQQGESFVICERNQPMATLQPLPKPESKKGGIVFGVLEGMCVLPDDFNEPLEDMEASIDKPLFP